jgi:hypothetical protein
MAENDIVAYPGAASGLTLTSTTAAWGTQTWTELTAGISTDLYIIGINYHPTLIPTTGTTIEMLMEIGTGAASSEVVKLQIPYSYKSFTAVSFYLMTTQSIFLPEPFFVPAFTRIAARFYDSHTAAVTYQQVKVRYKEGQNLGSFDPMGMLGFFGL